MNPEPVKDKETLQRLIDVGTNQLRDEMKQFIGRANTESTKHKIRKRVLKWINLNMRTSDKENAKLVANIIASRFLVANDKYNERYNKPIANSLIKTVVLSGETHVEQPSSI